MVVVGETDITHFPCHTWLQKEVFVFREAWVLHGEFFIDIDMSRGLKILMV